MLAYILSAVGGFLVASGLKRSTQSFAGGGVKLMADGEMMYARGGGVNGFVRMAQGGSIRKIKGNNFSEQIANGQKFKALIQKVFEDQKEDAYPLEFIKATALTPHPIVKIEGKNYISFKGTYSHEEFMDDPNFIQALEYVDRPKIRAK